MKYALCTVLLVFIRSNSIGQIYRDSIIDIHAHFWEMSKSADQYFAENKDLNIRTGGIVIIQKSGDLKRTREMNDELIKLSKTNRKIIPICTVHPYDGDSAVFELKRLRDLGVKMIKLHPITQEFDIEDDRVSRIVEEAGHLGIVVLMDAYTFFQKNNIEKLIYLAFRNRNTKFIFAHIGGPEFQKFGFLGFIKKTNSWFANNMWFDVSGTINVFADSPYKGEFEWAIRTIGIDRIIFGSDFPQFSVKSTMKALNKLKLTKNEKKMIVYSNAKKLLDLE
jgi:predicted TIM-barrel fold metal-dependent hydrolase